jgi:DUF2993 family protein
VLADTHDPVATPPAKSRLPRPGPVLVDLLIAVVVFALVAWGLDWASRIAAQAALARSVQRDEHLIQRPDVNVRGWFFVPQVVSGRYAEVDVTVHDVRSGALVLSRVTARLYGVHVSLHAVITGEASTILVEETHETAVFTYQHLNAYLKAQGSPITVSAGPSGQLRLSGHPVVLGHTLSVAADAQVQPVPGFLKITPTQLQTGSPFDAGSQLVLSRLTLFIPTAPLPFGQHVTAIHPQAHQLRVEAGGHDVVIARR